MAIEPGQAIAPQQEVQTTVAVGAPTKASPEQSRLLFLDNVRVLLIMLIIAGGAIAHAEILLGGLRWQAFAYALWESIVGVGMSLGLLVFFRRHGNRQGKWGTFLAANSYTSYLIQAPVIVCLASAAQDIHLYPLLKFALAVLVAVPLCFVLSHVIRKLPLAHKIL